MEQKSSERPRFLAIGLAALALLAVGIWLAMAPTAPPGPPSNPAPGTSVSAMATNPLDRAQIGHRIPEHGRLSLETGDLPMNGALELALDLPDEARGNDPLSVVIASVDGRRLEAIAAIAPGSGTGVQLEIDSIWLEPGRYMISVKTAEASHFPLRRYVLEIR